MALIKNEKKMTKSYFDVLGICCTSEVPLIENILKSMDGVKEYSVIVPTRTVIVVHDTLILSQFQIVKALNQARLEANVRVTGETNFKNKWPSPFAVVTGVLLLLSFFKYLYPPLRWLAVAAVVAGIYPIFAKAIASLARCRIDINILVVITVGATVAMRDYTEAAVVVFLFTIAEWLQSRASYKASAVMQSLMSLAPQKAVIAETGEEVEVDELKINTVIAVKAGETIPIDGVVVDGNCEVDEKTLTGEAFPVPKLRDSTVWAGTFNLNGYITVKTTALAEDCVVAKMAKLVEEAQNSKTETQRFIDECSKYYTPAIMVISIFFAVIPLALKVHNPKHWFHLALVVLVSACPCGLILSTPVATFCALTKAATSGLLIKGADYLETLAKIKIVAFDKTGTITRGEFIVMDFKSLSSDISLNNLLYWVSSAESKSSHPMAAALVDYAKSVSVEPKPEAVEDYQNFPGEGIYGKIDGKQVYIGNKRIASRAGCSSVPDIDVDTKGGKTVGYVYVGETLAGVFNLSDACRSGVAQAMKELKSLGIKTAMLTGDNEAAAMHAQEQLGNAMDIVRAELLPEGKSEIIKEFKREEGPTGMVGDGLNDAPALATADIGISMGVSGSALATETGNIILMSNDIRRIPQAIKLARRAKRKVVENVIISITMKVAILALAFAGHPLIWAAVLADVGTCLLVILNSMLLLSDKHKAGNKCYRESSSSLSSVLISEKLEGDAGGDMEAGFLPKNSGKHCESGCCGKKNQEKVVKSVKTSSDHGHTGCCEKKQDNVKTCCAELDVLGQGRDSGCCGDKTQKPHQHQHQHQHGVKQSCHEKPSGLETGTGSKQEDSSTLINLEGDEQGEVKVSVKGCCSSPAEASLKVRSNGHCKSSCCESSNKMDDKEEACSQVKEACKSNCSSRERSHHGSSCCRTYAKECGSHHHHHTRAAAGLGSLTEIVIE
ncbi:PREDICTED: cadmium/zinc-transporting ATPase HMA2-like [Camelina sativa]|uniref:Cadmium/zinc-transporting ATPase HMA2-like n=1 Tax=Camelina sativa TaxID=90675 RepID=A0ABM1QJQ4_CAMSA|nr:PREDICTED: cadmium/zinc-transporting ATPase HMA2-like [Camelina sativa]XP_019086992.1 PREDICTED: cadmium/zinc-transporting ATPase HMA2-like [Camelina sativa]